MSYWADKRVLVTGCTGFVGSWLTKRLVDEGATVVGLIWEVDTDAVFYQLGLHNHIACVPGDIADLPLLSEVLADHHIDTVFHLAAQAIVTKANVSPLETYESNTRGTWVLLEAVRIADSIQRVVVASSDKVYGEQEILPYLESTSLSAINPYDVSKACADLIAQSYAKTFHLPLAILRCGNIYGGGDLNFNRLIPGTIHAALKNEDPLIRSDGLFTRDYLHVDDVVSACLLVAQAIDEDRLCGEPFNFGNEQPFTVLEVVEEILGQMDCKHLSPVIQNSATAEIRHQYLSAAKAKEQLGWVPAHNLESGLRATIPWYETFLSEKGESEP